MNVKRSIHGQAMPDGVVSFGKEAFEAVSRTEIRWLGGAGILIHTYGTNIMLDPVLAGSEMPTLFPAPVRVEEVSNLDAVLITHIDCDHYSRATCNALKTVCKSFHAPQYVAQEMKKDQIDSKGHTIDEEFCIQDVKVWVTPVVHNWQNEVEEYQYREWMLEDYCGYFLETRDGNIWMPGDSKLMDEHLNLKKKPDVILIDFSDDCWHITMDGAVKLANAYPEAELICVHWGTIDYPDGAAFNSDPTIFIERVKQPERVKILNPGCAFLMKKGCK